ncbi:MAG: arginine--tRNA ligase [Defluviitaleaceae bacterium]|nr:arginine--tRNA ligase [Defluviitaleaceae bacterium]
MDIKYELAKKIGSIIDVDVDEIFSAVEIPANSEMGDYSYPCFRLSKVLKKAPPMIALDIAEKLNVNIELSMIESVEAVAGYVNFKLKKEFIVSEAFTKVFVDKDKFGSSNMGEGKTVVIDYSSPNIAKPLHIGHIRTTMIGAAIYKTLKFLGYNVVGINYLGDWGTQFGKMVVAINKWGGDRRAAISGGIESLVELYVKFHDEAEKDSSLEDEARGWTLKMESGDQEALEFWKEICDVSRKELDVIYERLGISFDSYRGESYYNDKMGVVVDELREKGLLQESQGAQVVMLDEWNMPPSLILRKDGGTLYPTRDIAAVQDRYDMYSFHKALYVTGLEQKLHFAQWFKVVELMGRNYAKDLEHISYGMISLDTGKLSTRAGNIVYLDKLLDEARDGALAIINERNPDLADKEIIAEQVGIGAIIFNDLYNNRIKDVTFSFDKILNFEGETGPYVQYSAARANSVLVKAGYTGNYKPKNQIDFSLITDKASVELAKLIYAYPDKILESAKRYEPYIIARHLMAIAQGFNYFYHENPILTADNDLREARLMVVYATREVLKAGLSLLNISAPEKM